MRSVYRKLGSSFCALSAALLLGVCAVSFWWQYHYLARDWTGRLEVYVGRSIVHIARDHRSKYFGGWATEKGFRRIGPGWFSNDPNIGFQYQRFNGDFKGVMDFYIPLLVPALLLAGATLRVWRGGRQKGHCRKCGYNLYGVTGPRCPECGATPRPDDFYLARPTPAPRIANASFFRMAAAWLLIVSGGTALAGFVWTVYERREFTRSLNTPRGAIEAANRAMRARGRDVAGLGASALQFNGGWDVHYGDPSDPGSFYVHVDSDGEVEVPQNSRTGSDQFYSGPRFGSNIFPILNSPGSYSRPASTQPASLPRDWAVNPPYRGRETQRSSELLTAANKFIETHGDDPTKYVPVFYKDGPYDVIVMLSTVMQWKSRILRIQTDGSLLETTADDLSRYVLTGALDHPYPSAGRATETESIRSSSDTEGETESEKEARLISVARSFARARVHLSDSRKPIVIYEKGHHAVGFLNMEHPWLSSVVSFDENDNPKEMSMRDLSKYIRPPTSAQSGLIP